MRLGYKCWLHGEEKIFGKGPYDLLCAISTYGSIKRASEELNMSYSKATHILKRCETHMGFKLLDSQIGGSEGGGSNLTREATHLMRQYRLFMNEIDVALKEAYEIYFGQFFDEIYDIEGEMPNILLLRGESGIGKSTIIKELVEPYAERFDGYEVHRYVPDEGEEPLGFEIAPFNSHCTTTTAMTREEFDTGCKDKNLFLSRGIDGVMQRRLDVLEAEIPRLIDRDGPLVVDEIGGMELTSEVLRERLIDSIGTGKPVIGVLKSIKRLKRLDKLTKGKRITPSMQADFIKELKEQSTVKVLEVTPSNKEFIKRYINRWLYTKLEE